MDNSLLSSVYIRFGDWAFNLLADENGKPFIFENAIYSVSWPDICAVFSMDSCVQALNLLFVPSKGYNVDNAASIMVCSIITDDKRLP